MEGDKPNREAFTDAKEYKRAYDRWRDKNLPNRKARNRDPERHAATRAWYAANREAVLKQKQVYFQENKVQINERHGEYRKARYHSDLDFRAKEIERAKAVSKANPEGRRAAKQRESERYHADPAIRAKIKEKNDAYRAQKIDKINERRADFRSRNRAMLAERQRARIANATPPWITQEQRREMFLVYKRAEELTALTGIPHEVDHVWPLKGKRSCGLHVPWNLQVLPSKENRSKLNREPAE